MGSIWSTTGAIPTEYAADTVESIYYLGNTESPKLVIDKWPKDVVRYS
jgi:hypothetical protein